MAESTPLLRRARKADAGLPAGVKVALAMGSVALALTAFAVLHRPQSLARQRESPQLLSAARDVSSANAAMALDESRPPSFNLAHDLINVTTERLLAWWTDQFEHVRDAVEHVTADTARLTSALATDEWVSRCAGFAGRLFFDPERKQYFTADGSIVQDLAEGDCAVCDQDCDQITVSLTPHASHRVDIARENDAMAARVLSLLLTPRYLFDPHLRTDSAEDEDSRDFDHSTRPELFFLDPIASLYQLRTLMATFARDPERLATLYPQLGQRVGELDAAYVKRFLLRLESAMRLGVYTSEAAVQQQELSQAAPDRKPSADKLSDDDLWPFEFSAGGGGGLGFQLVCSPQPSASGSKEHAQLQEKKPSESDTVLLTSGGGGGGGYRLVTSIERANGKSERQSSSSSSSSGGSGDSVFGAAFTGGRGAGAGLQVVQNFGRVVRPPKPAESRQESSIGTQHEEPPQEQEADKDHTLTVGGGGGGGLSLSLHGLTNATHGAAIDANVRLPQSWQAFADRFGQAVRDCWHANKTVRIVGGGGSGGGLDLLAHHVRSEPKKAANGGFSLGFEFHATVPRCLTQACARTRSMHAHAQRLRERSRRTQRNDWAGPPPSSLMEASDWQAWASSWTQIVTPWTQSQSQPQSQSPTLQRADFASQQPAPLAQAAGDCADKCAQTAGVHTAGYSPCLCRCLKTSFSALNKAWADGLGCHESHHDRELESASA